eukprot:256918_1
MEPISNYYLCLSFEPRRSILSSNHELIAPFIITIHSYPKEVSWQRGAIMIENMWKQNMNRTHGYLLSITNVASYEYGTNQLAIYYEFPYAILSLWNRSCKRNTVCALDGSQLITHALGFCFTNALLV